MDKKLKTYILYFLASLLILSIDIASKAVITNVAYYLFALLNLANSVRLITTYDNKRNEQNNV